MQKFLLSFDLGQVLSYVILGVGDGFSWSILEN